MLALDKRGRNGRYALITDERRRKADKSAGATEAEHREGAWWFCPC